MAIVSLSSPLLDIRRIVSLVPPSNIHVNTNASASSYKPWVYTGFNPDVTSKLLKQSRRISLKDD